MRSTRDILASVIYCIALILLLISFSISLPIICRPFYYAHIEALGLPAATGHSATDIRAAYDAVLDYLTLPGKEFSTGVFRHSEAGAAHFADCRGLFRLDGIVLTVSAAVVGGLWLLNRTRHIRLRRVWGFRLSAVSGAATVLTVATLTAIIAVDFNAAFVVFHRIFFSGKDNWFFIPREDEIIRALPQEFFMHCAILIGACLLLLSLTALLRGIRERQKARHGQSKTASD